MSLAQTSQLRLDRQIKTDLVQQIARDYQRTTHRGQVDWKRALREHPEWRAILGVKPSTFLREYEVRQTRKGQVIQSIELGGWYVHLYAVVEDDSFLLEWNLPDGAVGQKTYINEDDCLFSLHYCERVLFDHDPDLAKPATNISTLRVKPQKDKLSVTIN